MQKIRKITDLETYSVRQAVLCKGKPLSNYQFECNDLETTLHFGFFRDNYFVLFKLSS